MPSVKNRLAVEALSSVAIAAGYSTLATLVNSSRILIIYNNTTANITISYDGGTTDHQVLAPSATFLLDISSDRVWDAEFVMAANTVIKVKGSGAGTVYLTTFYAV